MSETKFFTTGDGFRAAYRIDGADDRPTLLLSNSIATNLHMWDRSVPDLASHFRLVRYDTRGHGESGVPVGAYSLDRLGRDVVELLDHLDMGRTHFLGLSLGGFVGQWLGIHAADRIDRLILSNTSPYLAHELPFDQQIRDTLATEDRSGIADGFLGNWFPPSWLSGRNEIVEAFREMVMTTSPQGLAGCYAALRDVDLRRTIALIDRPTLVIAGEHDMVTKPEHGEEIARTIPGAELVILSGVHILNVEQPKAFISAVGAFLRDG